MTNLLCYYSFLNLNLAIPNPQCPVYPISAALHRGIIKTKEHHEPQTPREHSQYFQLHFQPKAEIVYRIHPVTYREHSTLSSCPTTSPSSGPPAYKFYHITVFTIIQLDPTGLSIQNIRRPLMISSHPETFLCDYLPHDGSAPPDHALPTNKKKEFLRIGDGAFFSRQIAKRSLALLPPGLVCAGKFSSLPHATP